MTPVIEVSRILGTDSGMFAVWVPEGFAEVDDYDSWEEELLEDEDIQRHIQAGAFVPVNIGSDGAFSFTLRIGTGDVVARLTEREERHLLVSSDPYLLVSQGRVAMTAIEDVDRKPKKKARVDLDRGEYAVVVHLVDWQAEPGATRPDGEPSESALSDFVVLVNKASSSGQYRTAVETFEAPDE